MITTTIKSGCLLLYNYYYTVLDTSKIVGFFILFYTFLVDLVSYIQSNPKLEYSFTISVPGSKARSTMHLLLSVYLSTNVDSQVSTYSNRAVSLSPF